MAATKKKDDPAWRLKCKEEGARMRKCREALGWGWDRAAKAWGISPDTIRSCEQGSQPIGGAAMRLVEIYENPPPGLIGKSDAPGMGGAEASPPMETEEMEKAIQEVIDRAEMVSKATGCDLRKAVAFVLEQRKEKGGGIT